MIEIDLKENPFLIFQDGKLKAFSEIQNLVAANKPDNDIVKKVLAIAEKERLEGGQDFKETTGSNSGPQVDKYLKFVGLSPGSPWCASFVSWVLNQAGVTIFRTADTWEIERLSKIAGILSDVPGPGDVFLQLDENGRPKHTGFVKSIDSSDVRYLLTIEGNAGDSIKNCNDKLIKNCKFVKWQKVVK